MVATNVSEKNLYVLDTHSIASLDNNHIVNNVDDFDAVVLHGCLSNPSQVVLDHLPFPCKHSNYICTTCHEAKQTRITFPTSPSQFVACFDLIHIDIWGPVKETSYSGAHYIL